MMTGLHLQGAGWRTNGLCMWATFAILGSLYTASAKSPSVAIISCPYWHTGRPLLAYRCDWMWHNALMGMRYICQWWPSTALPGTHSASCRHGQGFLRPAPLAAAAGEIGEGTIIALARPALPACTPASSCMSFGSHGGAAGVGAHAGGPSRCSTPTGASGVVFTALDGCMHRRRRRRVPLGGHLEIAQPVPLVVSYWSV